MTPSISFTWAPPFSLTATPWKLPARAWKHARQFHKVSLSVWIAFLCISFSKQPNSNSKKKQPLTETHAIISTVIHTHTKVWSWQDKPVTHVHWHMMVTHRNMNRNMRWTQRKRLQWIWFAVPRDWLNDLIQVFHQDACLHREAKVKMHTGSLTNCYRVLVWAHLCVQQCDSKLQRKLCISLSSLQSPFHLLSLSHTLLNL